jgi:3-keto-L-gulonate-6-phosphate decarboxylase
MFKSPDITPAQIVAVVGAVIAVAVAGGLNISQDLQDSIIRLVSILAPILIAGDAVVRHGRATGSAKKDGGA